METIDARFQRLSRESSDISAHFQLLHSLATAVDHITEMGVRYGVSTTVLYYGLVRDDDNSDRKLVCYDSEPCPEHKVFLDYATEAGMPQFVYHQKDSSKVEIEPTDFLFLDTYHTYRQVTAELQLHAPRVGRWIALHDTTSFGEQGEDGMPGVWHAVEEFITEGSFRLRERWTDQNGFTLLERI